MTGVVLVRYLDLDRCGDGPAQRRLLDEDELARLGRIAVPRTAARFVAAHAALRLTVARYCGVPPGRVRWARTPNGMPLVAAPDPEVRVSLSHTGGHAAVAVTRGRGIGIDLEGAGEPRRLPSSVRGMSVGPGGFPAAWTRMEACVKAVGGRLTEGLPLLAAGPGVVRAEHGALAGTTWYVRQLAAPPGCAAALAGVGAAPVAVDLGRFRPPVAWRSGQPGTSERKPETSSVKRSGSSTHGR
ncbi:4'-phosphopantetheinyl transferase superfamily protein [Streptomyces sp. NRRL B-24572]|uniref:4'-phosphopantetheinyl transferase family protein n=1 Tax=Streptomyces sp. NRRL B-24572 TaxID=1962156 RepID=UPI000A38A9A9|nr:hypothetical protein [Streptomyces sp. NRRL B-24572]